MSGGYRESFHAEVAPVSDAESQMRPHRIVVSAWQEKEPSLVSLVSGYDLEVINFRPEDLDAMITLLQDAKTALAGSPMNSGAAVPSYAAVPVKSA